MPTDETVGGFLHRYFLANGDKQIHKWLHYFDIYERHFARFRGAAPVVLEIGVQGGGSLGMWRSYFGPGSHIVGLDIDPACKAHAGEGIDVVIGDQADGRVLASLVETYGAFDIVIDDGSHRMDDVRRTFAYLYERISPRGVYLVEDMHTAYLERFGGGLHAKGSFIEFSKALIDELHACHTDGAVKVSPFTRSTDGIAFYDGVVVFERRPQGRRQHVITNPM